MVNSAILPSRERTQESRPNSNKETRPKIPIKSLLHEFAFEEKWKQSQKETDAKNLIIYWRWKEQIPGTRQFLTYERGWFYGGDDYKDYEGHEWEKLENLGPIGERLNKFTTLPPLNFAVNEMGQILEQGNNPKMPERSWRNSWLKATSINKREFNEFFFEGFSVKPKTISTEGGRLELVITDPHPKTGVLQFLRTRDEKEIRDTGTIAGNDVGVYIALYPREMGYVLEQGKERTKSPAGTFWFNAAWQVIR